MAAVFTVGTIAFWIVITLVCSFIIGLLENEKFGWLTSLTVVYLAMFYFMGDTKGLNDFFVGIWQNPLGPIFWFIGYTLFGLFWSFFRWYIYLKDYKKEHEGKDMSYYRPYLNEHKNSIVAWIVYWPLSVLWFVINKPIKGFFDWIFNLVRGIYQGILNKMFKEE